MRQFRCQSEKNRRDKNHMLHIRVFPNGTCLFFVVEQGVERMLFRVCADGAVERNVEHEGSGSGGGCEVHWERIREPTGSYIADF